MATNRIVDGFAAIVEAEFEERSRSLMEDDLEKSGLDDNDLMCVPLKHPPVPMPNPQWVIGGYRIRYYSPDGVLIEGMYRDRLFYRSGLTERQLKEAGLGKYRGPSAEFAASQGADSRMPYMLPHGDGEVGVICEGEKKTAAALDRFGCHAMGLGGAWNWSDGSEHKRLHPCIVDWVEQRGLEVLLIIADPDIYDGQKNIKKGYSGLQIRLQARFPDLDVRVLSLENKLDDYLVEHEAYGLDALLAEDTVEGMDLSLSIRDLARQYELQVKENARGEVSGLHRNPYNVSTLLEKHPRWAGQIRYNDDQQILELFGEPLGEAGVLAICKVMNRNLGMPELGLKMVEDCVKAIAEANTYSPAKEEVLACGQWDGVERMKDIFGEGRTKNDQEIAKALVVGYVKRVLSPGCFWRIMVILVGGQGLGKTGTALWLVGGKKNEGDWRVRNRIAEFHPKDLRSGDKDIIIRLMTSKLALFDDIDHFGQDERGKMKAIVSQTHSVNRPAFGKHQKTYLRSGIMMGTSNMDEVLPDDPTGNTRFVAVELKEVQRWEWLYANRGQIIAEGRAFVENGEELDIDWAAVTARYVQKNVMFERLEEFVEEIKDDQKSVYLVRGRKGSYIRMTGFFTWLNGGQHKNPTHWEINEFKQWATRLGLVPHLSGGSFDRDQAGNTIKRVWELK